MIGLKQIKRNLTAITAASFVERAVSFVLVVFIARSLGADVYGKYAFAVALASFLSLLSDLGTSSYLTRDLAKDPDSSARYLGQALSLKLFSSTLLFVGILVLAVSWSQLQTSIEITLLVCASLLIRGLANTFFAVVRAHQMMQFEAYAVLLNRLLAAVAGLTVLFLTENLIYTLIAMLFSSLAELLYIGAVVNRKFAAIRLDLGLAQKRLMIMASLPFLINGGMALINHRLDTVILKFISGDAITGLYNSAYSLILSLIIIREIFGRVLLPLFSQLSSQDPSRLESSYKQALKLLVLIAFFITLMGTIFSQEIIEGVFGPAYLPAVSCFRILIWSVLFLFASYVPTLTLLAIDAEREVLKARLASAGLNVFLNLLLIPKYNMVGASVATVISEAAYFGSCYFYLVRRHLPLLNSVEWLKLAFPFAAGLLIAGFISHDNVVLGAAAVIMVYAFILYFGGSFSKEDKLTLERLIRS